MAEQESLIQTDFTDPRVAVRVRELREQLGRMPTGKEVQDSLVSNPLKILVNLLCLILI